MKIVLPYSVEHDLARFRAHKINGALSRLSVAKEAGADDSALAPFQDGVTFWQDLSLEDLLVFAVMEACWRYEE